MRAWLFQQEGRNIQGSAGGRSLARRIRKAVLDFLNVGRSPERVDCIFVFAGRFERKVYGLDLYQQGYAKRIVFSVGRFEWRRFPELGLDQDGGLAGLVEKTAPRKRHFFVDREEAETRCFLIRKGLLGTLSEGAALSRFIAGEDIKSLLIVSSAFHLRRAVETVRRYCSDASVRIVPVAANDRHSTGDGADSTEPGGLTLAIECVKYLCYRLLLF